MAGHAARFMMLGLILALSAGCAAAPQQSPTFEPRKRPDLENIPQASLTIGQEKHLRLKDVDIDANLLLTEQPDFYQLELKLAVPGDWERSVGWDEKELSARLLFESGSESKGWNSSVEGLSWGGCLHGWRTQATLRFSKLEGDAIPRNLEINVFNSHRILRLEHP